MMAYLEHVSSGVVFQCPGEGSEHLNNVLWIEDWEEAVEKDLQSNGQGLTAVEGQAGHVENRVG